MERIDGTNRSKIIQAAEIWTTDHLTLEWNFNKCLNVTKTILNVNSALIKIFYVIDVNYFYITKEPV